LNCVVNTVLIRILISGTLQFGSNVYVQGKIRYSYKSGKETEMDRKGQFFSQLLIFTVKFQKLHQNNIHRRIGNWSNVTASTHPAKKRISLT
jgi:hypothetical protein